MENNNSLPFRRSSSNPQFSDETLAPMPRTQTLAQVPNHQRSKSAAGPVHLSPDESSSSARSRSSFLSIIQELAPICFPSKKSNTDAAQTEAEAEEKTLREIVMVPAAAEPDPTTAPSAAAAAAAAVVSEREYIWAYKYRPRFLNEFICNRDGTKELLGLVNKQQFGHFIFEGPAGVGKRTMVLAFLRGVVGQENLKTTNELRKIEFKEEHLTSIDVKVRTSSRHIEVNLSELRGYEKHVIVALINESRAPLDKVPCSDHYNSRAIVLHESDKLSTDAQHYVRWLMEKYKGCNKIFFCCHDSSKLQTIKHLCKIVKLQPPSDSEVVDVLEHIAKKECIDLPHNVAETIAKNSKRNLRQAIRSFEASWKSNHSFTEDHVILTGWEDDIANIAKSIVNEQSPRQLYLIRGKLKKLIEHNVSPDFIFNILISELKKLLDDQFQTKIDALYQEYKIPEDDSFVDPEKSLSFSLDTQEDFSGKFKGPRKNVRYFMRIEEFSAKFMSFYKSGVTKGVSWDKMLLRG